MNSILVERDEEITSLLTDLSDGTKLRSLLEILSRKTIKINSSPKMRIQRLENVNYILDFIKDEGLKLISISANNIVDGDKKLIFGISFAVMFFLILLE